jgi:hypothetical protein
MKGPNEIDVAIYVDGEKKEFELSLHQSVQSVISKVVAQLGLNRPQTDYDLRWFESGVELDRDSSLESSGVKSESVLVLGLKAGIGG